MLYFLIGNDNLRKKRALAKILDEIKKKSISLERMDVDFEEDGDYKNVIDFLNQRSIFGGEKVVVIKNSGLDEKKWLDFLKSEIKESKNFIFLLEDKKNESFNVFKKENSVFWEEYNELEGPAIRKFIEEESKNYGISLSKEALENLSKVAEFLESERSFFLSKELEKASFLGGKILNWSDFEEISYFPYFDKVWKMTKEILSSIDLAKKIAALEKLILSGVDYEYIFNSLASNSSGKDTIFISELDYKIKSGSLDYQSAILLFCLESVKLS
jgi:DNA polymerase III delta subunit